MGKILRIGIVPDTHRPYHDVRAVNLMMRAFRGFKPDTLIVLGDYGDFYQVSSHGKDLARRPSLAEEIASVNEGLNELDSLGAKRRVYIEGNHENRLDRYLQSEKARDSIAELVHSGVIDIKGIPELFRLRQRGWEFVPYKEQIRIGKVFYSHDYGKAGDRAHIDAEATVQSSVVIGHTHSMAYSVKGNMKGKPHVAAMFGWLGDARNTDYMYRAKAMRQWSLGFGIGYMDAATGNTWLVPCPIVDYRVVVDGRMYAA